jgi:hypothetical protein
MGMAKCTILCNSETREKLKQIGKKGQTYDDILNELIEIKGSQRIIV